MHDTQIVQDSEVPADIVFLSSSDSTNVCYVETANLDGGWVGGRAGRWEGG